MRSWNLHHHISSTLVLFISLIHDNLLVNLSISQFDMAIVPTSEPASANYSLFAELSTPQFVSAIVPLSDPAELSIPQPALLVLLNVFVSTKILLLLFNKQIFYTLSNVLKYICNSLEVKKRVHLYLDIVKQALNIFDLGSVFAAGLINAIKKDKS